MYSECVLCHKSQQLLVTLLYVDDNKYDMMATVAETCRLRYTKVLVEVKIS